MRSVSTETFPVMLGEIVEVAFVYGERRAVRWSAGEVKCIEPLRVQVWFPCDDTTAWVPRRGHHALVIRKPKPPSVRQRTRSAILREAAGTTRSRRIEKPARRNPLR